MSRVLLLEDDPDVRPLLENILIADGREVDVAETVAGARTYLAANDYDLVLAGGMLPDGDGVQIADQAERCGTKTIMLIGDAFSIAADRLYRHEVLFKPVRPAELLSSIYRHIGPGRMAEMTGAR
jgi:DNA-binding response OmpR family regulator